MSTDKRDDADSIVATLGLEFPVLYDTEADVARSWSVFNLLGDGVAAPATFVFDAEGSLRAYKIGKDSGDRPTAQLVLDTIRAFGTPGPDSSPPAAIDLSVAEGFECLVPLEGEEASCDLPPDAAHATPVATTTPEITDVPTGPGLLSLAPPLVDFTLPDANTGEELALTDLLDSQDVVLVFYRAFW